jgi:small neutral amino acid transporter SnatA (MarC family)
VGAYAALALGASALLADPVLDALDLSPEGFWIAAGIILLVPAFARLGWGDTRDVAGPGAIAVAMALATRDGTGSTLVAVAIAVASIVAASTFLPAGRATSLAERFIGAAMVVVALDLIRDGVIAV